MKVPINKAVQHLMEISAEQIKEKNREQNNSRFLKQSLDIQFKELAIDGKTQYTYYSIPNNAFNVTKFDLSLHFREEVKLDNIRIVINDIDITDALKIEYEADYRIENDYLPAVDELDILKIKDYFYPWQKGAITSNGRSKIEVIGLDQTKCDINLLIYYQVPNSFN